MNWLTQKTGLIDHSQRSGLIGTQPIRVVHPMVMYLFSNSHPQFSNELNDAIRKGLINPEIDFQIGEDSIAIPGSHRYRTPRFNYDSKKIELHETFLSYQWCVTYALYITFLETIDYPNVNKNLGYEKYPISIQNIEKANEVFEYGKSLIPLFFKWDKTELPNPETYLAENRDYIEQTNIFYTEAMKFIMLHEYTHATLHKCENSVNADKSYFLNVEYEADNKAMEHMFQGKNGLNRWAVECGPIFGLISMIYFRSITTGEKHPNVEDRLTNALEKMEVGDNEYAWAFACTGLRFWCDQWQVPLDWSKNGQITYKELYYELVKQIKARN